MIYGSLYKLSNGTSNRSISIALISHSRRPSLWMGKIWSILEI